MEMKTQLGALAKMFLAIAAVLILTGSCPFTALTITNNNPPQGTVGVSYNNPAFSFTATGGVPCANGLYVWSKTAGTFPAGLSFDTNTGSVTGTPTTATTYSYTMQVADCTFPTPVTKSQAYSTTINGSAPTCGPPSFCASTSASVIQAPSPAPFTAASVAGDIGYDMSLNGTNVPIMQIADINTCGGNGISLVGISGGDENGVINSNDTLAAINCVGGTLKFRGFTLSPFVTTGLSGPMGNVSGGTTFAKVDSTKFYSQSQGNGTTIFPKVYLATFSSTNPPVFSQSVLFDPAVACAPMVPASGVTGGTISIDKTDTYLWGVLISNGQNSPGYVYRYNLSTGKCFVFSTLTATNNIQYEDGSVHTAAGQNLCLPITVHNSTIFGNGQWGRMTTGPITGGCTNQPYYIQAQTTNVFGCGAGSGTGHNSNGYNLEVEANNPNLNYSNDITSNSAASFCAALGTQSYGLFPYQGITGDLETHFSYGWDTSDCQL
jgi:hypothetical protein